MTFLKFTSLLTAVKHNLTYQNFYFANVSGMTEPYSNHARFTLLNPGRRWFDSRTVLSVTVVTLSVIIFCGVYSILLRSQSSILFPKASTFQVPSHWVYRAKLYNDYSVFHRNKTEIYAVESERDVDEYKLVCYYNFPSEDGLKPSNLDPFLCTHINLAFASISDGVVSLDRTQLGIARQVVSLKLQNKNLKVLLSVGGAGNEAGFATMVMNHVNRKKFIKSVLDWVKDEGIDGVDLDWEFPSQFDDKDKKQKLHFVQLLIEFRKVINRQAKHKFLVSVAVAAPPYLVDTCYDAKHMSTYVDFVNVMTYDFHFYTRMTPFTGLNSPLFECEADKGYFSSLTINYSVNYWLSQGMERSKIIVGLPTYGHSFRLVNVGNNGLYAPVRGYGRLGTNGFVDYAQVCDFLIFNEVSPVFEDGAESPYFTKSTEWVSFDNEQSLSIKTEYIKDEKLGGVMIYALNTDDWKGTCKDPKIASPGIPFPLTKKVQEVLGRNYSIF